MYTNGIFGQMYTNGIFGKMYTNGILNVQLSQTNPKAGDEGILPNTF